MNRLILFLGLIGVFSFPAGFYITGYAIEIADAQVIDAAEEAMDAGVQPDAALGTVGTLPDLGEPDAKDPEIIVRTVHDLREREGLWAAITAAVYMVLKLLQMAKWNFVLPLRKGRMPAILAATTGGVGSVYEYFTHVISGYAVLGVVIVTATALVTAVYTPPVEDAGPKPGDPGFEPGQAGKLARSSK